MTTIPLRVMVLDVWQEFAFEVEPDLSLAELKRKALAAARIARPSEGYQVKFRGAALEEQGRTVADAGLVPNAALIVLPRRRTPVH